MIFASSFDYSWLESSVILFLLLKISYTLLQENQRAMRNEAIIVVDGLMRLVRARARARAKHQGTAINLRQYMI